MQRANFRPQTLSLVGLALFLLTAHRPRALATSRDDSAALNTPVVASISCSTGAELAAAFADPRASSVEVVGDLKLRSEDWDLYELPIQLNRNFVVAGSAARPPAIDFSYLRAKIRLGPGITLTFRHIVLLNYRSTPFNIAIGLDLLGPMRPNETAVIRLEHGGLAYRACFPLTVARNASQQLPSRPASVPGQQSYMLPAPQSPDCVKSTAVPYMDRCYAYIGLYIDVALPCYDLVTVTGSLEPNGYVIQMLGLRGLCITVMSTDCIEALGPLGCTLVTLKQLPELTIPGEAAASAQFSTEVSTAPSVTVPAAGGREQGNSTWAIVLGGVSGGVVLLGGVIGIVIVQRRWRGRGQDGHVNRSFSVRDAGVDEERSSRLSDRAYQATFMHRHLNVGAPEGRPQGSQIQQQTPMSEASKAGSHIESASQQPAEMRQADHQVISGSKPFLGGVAFERTESADLLASRLPSDAGEAVFSEFNVITHSTPRRLDLPTNILLQKGSSTETAGNNGATLHTTTASRTVGGSKCFSPAAASISRQAAGSPANQPSAVGTGDEPQSNLVTLLPVLLGKGAFGRVYEGEYQGARVAVKVVNNLLPFCGNSQQPMEQQAEMTQRQQQQQPPAPPGDNDAVSQFVQEVEVLGRCQHPNVVRLLAACLTPPRLCLVMELMETSLERLIFGGGPNQRKGDLLPLPKVLHIGIQICQGLAYLHPTIIHRDLKPANVLINGADSDYPVVKLSDFGLSRLCTTTNLFTKNPDAGTPAYLAPECYDLIHSTLTNRADIYSLGVLLWVMLTGERPWKDCTPFVIAFKVAVKQERLPVDDHLPRKLRQLICRCWMEDPQQRPAAAEVMKELLVIQEMTKVTREAEDGPVM